VAWRSEHTAKKGLVKLKTQNGFLLAIPVLMATMPRGERASRQEGRGRTIILVKSKRPTEKKPSHYPKVNSFRSNLKGEEIADFVAKLR